MNDAYTDTRTAISELYTRQQHTTRNRKHPTLKVSKHPGTLWETQMYSIRDALTQLLVHVTDV